MKDYVYESGVPPRLRSALSENAKAWERFNAMTDAQRQEFIRQTEGVRTKEDLRSLVDGFVGWEHAHPPVQL